MEGSKQGRRREEREEGKKEADEETDEEEMKSRTFSRSNASEGVRSQFLHRSKGYEQEMKRGMKKR